MKIYRLIHSVTIIILLMLNFSYGASAGNVSHHFNLLFSSNLNSRDGKNFIYCISGLSVFLNYLIVDQHKLLKLLYLLLIMINSILILLCIIQF